MTSSDPLTRQRASGAPAANGAAAPADPGREAERLRYELAATLGAIEDKLNVPRRLRRGIRRMSRENPIALAAIGVVSAAAVGGAVWAAVAWLKNRD